jgi:hypothetical protein
LPKKPEAAIRVRRRLMPFAFSLEAEKKGIAFWLFDD